jgi:hypothetical protein
VAMYSKELKIIAVALFFGGLLQQNNTCAQSNIYKIHSLFLYNFTKHINWSEDVGDSFTIGVYGSSNALAEVKSNFSGKKFSGKEFRVINIAGLGDVKASDMVYFPKSNKNKILNLFEDVDKSNTLFVSEDDLIQYGIPISFVIRNNKLAFKVSKKNLESLGLKISSSLLSLAEVVD